MGLFFRKIPKKMLKIKVRDFPDSEKRDLDDIVSPALTSIGCFVMQQPARDELILELEKDGIAEQQVLNIFADLGMQAAIIVDRGFVYAHEYGLPKFHITVHKQS